jgi:hypothetical protein
MLYVTPNIWSFAVTDDYKFIEYHSTYVTRSTASNGTRTIGGNVVSIATTPLTDEISYGLSRRLAASQARRAQEIVSDDPGVELTRYLNDPLELPGTDILNFWMVSIVSSNGIAC